VLIVSNIFAYFRNSFLRAVARKEKKLHVAGFEWMAAIQAFQVFVKAAEDDTSKLA